MGNLNTTRCKNLDIEYSSKKVEEQCTSVKAAKKLFWGGMILIK